ncbi:MAG: DUF1844 domain-containing protein [Actinomycetota bacterium]|nr:DUF1844 domain-containing protein [Actinomycetota bacterium]
MSSTSDQVQPESDDAKIENEDGTANLDQLRKEILASTPEVIIANHCFGLFELAAIYLSDSPPQLGPATLAIDALAGITEALKGRLGNHEQELLEGVSQLRLAYIQVSAL